MDDSDRIVNLLTLINRSVAQLNTSIQQAFPEFGSSATTATGGSATLPSNPVGFLSVTDSTGQTRKIPYYNP